MRLPASDATGRMGRVNARGGRLLAIAHRSGNSLDGLRDALAAGVDLVECDVYAHRGRLEVRHLRSMGRVPYLWDTGVLIRRDAYDLLELPALVAALDGDSRLMIDLKGLRPRVAGTVAALLREVAPGRPLTVCGKSWWNLDVFDPPVRRVLSASNRVGLARLRRRLARTPAYGASVERRLLTPDLVTELQRSTEVVMTWPVDTAEELADARRLGVDAVISKNLPLLGEVLAGGRDSV
ncbi:MAG: glycerophosphoryl diester phosphodiesterase [Actinomycetota bacterium]|nr:glycerophosphoryl diester phosphodiesterase [Actinomycetota bacterium]